MILNIFKDRTDKILRIVLHIYKAGFHRKLLQAYKIIGNGTTNIIDLVILTTKLTNRVLSLNKQSQDCRIVN